MASEEELINRALEYESSSQPDNSKTSSEEDIAIQKALEHEELSREKEEKALSRAEEYETGKVKDKKYSDLVTIEQNGKQYEVPRSFAEEAGLNIISEMPEIEQRTEREELQETGRDFTTGAMQGLTFGYGDELAAKIAEKSQEYGLPIGADIAEEIFTGDTRYGETKSKTYEDLVSKYRANLKKSQERSPIASTAGEISGALATSLIPGGAVGKMARIGKPAATGLGRTRQALQYGAVSGGLYGGGKSDAPIGTEEFTSDVAKGAALGAGTGGSIAGLGSGFKSTIGKGADVLESISKKPEVVEKNVKTFSPAAGALLGEGLTGGVTGGVAGAYLGSKLKGGLSKKTLLNLNKQLSKRYKSDTEKLTEDAARDKIKDLIKQYGKVKGTKEAIKNIKKAPILKFIDRLDKFASTDPTVAKYLPRLSNAASKGVSSAIAEDFTLQQSDPEYRLLKNRLNKEED